MKRKLFVGTAPQGRRGYVNVELREKEDGPELAIQAEIGHPSSLKVGNGDCYGQCIDEVAALEPRAPWTPELLAELVDTWRRWHLNGMRAGCEHQRAEGWGSDRVGEPCPTCGYEYGTAWLHEELPADVIERVTNWPNG